MQEGSGAQYYHSMRGAAGEFPLGGPLLLLLLVSPHIMRGRELSTLVVILSVCHSVITGKSL